MEKYNKEYFSTVLKMMSEISNKRNGIKEIIEFTSAESEVKQLTELYIKHHFDIDYNLVSDYNQYLEYEEKLGQYLSFIINPLLEPEFCDYDTLFRKSKEFDVSNIFSSKIIIEKSDRELLKKYGIGTNIIEIFLKSPDFARYIEIDECEFIFCTKCLGTPMGKRILFYGMMREDGLYKPYNIFDLTVFRYKLFSDMLNSPLRLFLYLIDEYGIDLTVRGITKKLFVKMKNNFYNDEMIKLGEENTPNRTIFMPINKKTGDALLFHGLNRDLLMSDYKRAKI